MCLSSYSLSVVSSNTILNFITESEAFLSSDECLQKYE
jgi:hypothetical protein